MGVGGRHVGRAVDLPHRGVERAPHHQPHDELDALGPGFAEVGLVVDLRLRLGVLHETVEEGEVEVHVDQTGPLPLELMRHPPGSEHRDPFRPRPGRDGPPDRLPQPEAAPPGGCGVLHHVHAQRDHAAGPRIRLPVHHRQRDGEPVIDGHLVDDREVELVEDQRLGQVPRQLRMARHRRDGPGPVPLVGRIESRRHTDGEGGDHFQGEGRRMVVVDDHAHVGTGLGHPTPRRLDLLEVGRPVGIGLLGVVDRRPDRGDVRGPDPPDDLSHRSARSADDCPRSSDRRFASSR